MLWNPGGRVGSVGVPRRRAQRGNGVSGRWPVLVVIAFESMFGNTREVAEAVADELRGGAGPVPRVELGVASAIDPQRAGRADLLVVGGPTHYHGLATRNSLITGRQLQRRAVLTGQLRPRGIDGLGELGYPPAAGRPTTLPDPSGSTGAAPGGDVDLRAWLRCLPQGAGRRRAAAFDTRVTSRWAGGAAFAIARRLRRHGYHLVVPPEGFLIDGLLGPLRPGEVNRARMWGACLRRQLAR